MKQLICVLLLCGWTACCAFETTTESVELGVGWRRDSLNWKVKKLQSDYVSARVDSNTHFGSVDYYTIYGKALWMGPSYYIRCSGDYGRSVDGREKECFKITSPFLGGAWVFEESAPIQRRSEAYDFHLAIGYPFWFDCYRYGLFPVIGFSYQKQHLRTKHKEDSSSSSYLPSSSSSFPSSSSDDSSFSIDSSNPFGFGSSNPFSSPSSSVEESRIASGLGLSAHRRCNSYRMTWYGPFLGLDALYALDNEWTLFGSLEAHFLDNCHRKRKTWTGVYFVDRYRKRGWAYGYQAICGTNVVLPSSWYASLAMDYNWFKSAAGKDTLHWCNVGLHATLGWEF